MEIIKELNHLTISNPENNMIVILGRQFGDTSKKMCVLDANLVVLFRYLPQSNTCIHVGTHTSKSIKKAVH